MGRRRERVDAPGDLLAGTSVRSQASVGPLKIRWQLLERINKRQPSGDQRTDGFEPGVDHTAGLLEHHRVGGRVHHVAAESESEGDDQPSGRAQPGMGPGIDQIVEDPLDVVARVARIEALH